MDNPAKIISDIRSTLDMPMRDFAKPLGVSHNSVAQWEAGIAKPNLQRLAAWSTSETDWVRDLANRLLSIEPTYQKLIENHQQPIGASSGA